MFKVIWLRELIMIVFTLNWADAGKDCVTDYWNISVIVTELVLVSVTQPLWKSRMGISTK